MLLHEEGALYMLQTAFSEEDTVPANFYLGLCADTLVIGDGLADILNEPSTGSYARIAVASSDVGFVTATVTGTGAKFTVPEVEFTPSGASWADIDTVFLATTVDNTGLLIASWSREAAATVADGIPFKPSEVMTLRNPV